MADSAADDSNPYAAPNDPLSTPGPVPPRPWFTLVELLVVIAIIAVSTALLVPVTKSTRHRHGRRPVPAAPPPVAEPKPQEALGLPNAPGPERPADEGAGKKKTADAPSGRRRSE
jgi:prepilin-type N-terminal cleavage/methylation domain-containing protein